MLPVTHYIIINVSTNPIIIIIIITITIIKGCSDVFVPVLKHIFNLSLSQQYFPTLWKEAAIIPVLKKAKAPLLVTTGQ
jgi:hypothetical protein